MLDTKTFDDFRKKVDQSYQQFCVWEYVCVEYLKYQQEWKKGGSNGDRKYKNFFNVVIPSLQHSWILSLARLFDPAYYQCDRSKSNMSLRYIVELLDNTVLKELVTNIDTKYSVTIKSLKAQRDKVLAHNDVNFQDKKIEAGVKELFREIALLISEIEKNELHLKVCNGVDLKYIESLSFHGVHEIFEKLLQS
jgi:hypothetical protein